MVTERMIRRLDNLVAKYAFRDFRAVNKERCRRVHPYTLSESTNEAREMRNLAMKRDITPGEEKQIKSYYTLKLMTGELDDILEFENKGERYDPAKA